jgi:hypothetical protein
VPGEWISTVGFGAKTGSRIYAFSEIALGKRGPCGAVWLQRYEWQRPEIPDRLLLVLVVVLVLVIEKIELVKPFATWIEDENEDDDDIPAVFSTFYS